MTREDKLIAMNGAMLIKVADNLGVKVACNRTRTALKEAKGKVVERILAAEAAQAEQTEQEAPVMEEDTQAAPVTEEATQAEQEVPATEEAEQDAPATEESKQDEPTEEAPATEEAEQDEPTEEAPAAEEIEQPKQNKEKKPAKKKEGKAPAKEKKQEAPDEATAEKLTGIFEKLNDSYFDSLLPLPAFQVRKAKRTYDCCSVKKGEGESQYIVNIGLDAIEAPIEKTAAAMLHAMVHLYCAEAGIAETCQHGRYHNAKFKAECEARDLTVEYDSANGYVHTAASDKLVAAVNEK